MATRSAFVTGGTGFVGLNLVELLTQSGWDVTALHRPNSNLTYLKKYPVRLVEGIIEDPASISHALPEDVDAVFHVAGDTSMWSGHRQRQWRTNVEGTRNLVDAALAKRAKKFVHTSTTGVYGMPKDVFDETCPKLGKGSFDYQRSKTMAEEEVLGGVGRGLDAVIMNPANIIGRYDWNSWSLFIRKAANKQLIFIPPGSACYCDVNAVVRAHVTAVDKGRTGENYILGGPQVSYRELVQIIGKVLNRPVETRVGHPLGLRGTGRVLDWVSRATRAEPMVTPESAAFLCTNIVCRSEKAMRELDYKPASIEAMLKESIDWLISENRLGPVAAT